MQKVLKSKLRQVYKVRCRQTLLDEYTINQQCRLRTARTQRPGHYGFFTLILTAVRCCPMNLGLFLRQFPLEIKQDACGQRQFQANFQLASLIKFPHTWGSKAIDNVPVDIEYVVIDE